MKYFIISDIHANYSALDRVLNIIKRKAISKIIILGDLVGYGGEPNQVVSRVRTLKNAMIIRGNHDKVASGVEDGRNFNNSALKAVLWTKRRLTSLNREFLFDLPAGPLMINDEFEVVHGSTTNEDDYILSDYDAAKAAGLMKRDICFFGHSHLPVIFEIKGNSVEHHIPKKEREEYRLKPGFKYLINPGSVGQPRDRNPMASCVIYDSDCGHLQIYRTAYDIARTTDRINRAELPEILAKRLSRGE